MPIEVTGLAELVRTLEEARSRAPTLTSLTGAQCRWGTAPNACRSGSRRGEARRFFLSRPTPT